jgi:DNA-binding NarL/FixJ family response regulator
MRVVIGEDEALLREGLVLMLRAHGIEVVATAADAAELVRVAGTAAPDLVITDVRMPPDRTDDGLRAALQIRRRAPTPILILSQYVHRQYLQELTADGRGAVGYMLKQRVSDGRSFCADAERVAGGGTVLDPEVVTAMMARARRDDDALDRLTPRQHEVLALVAQGRSNAGIARRLAITEKAVVQHISRIYEQLGLSESDDDHRRVLVVARYLSG